MALPDRDDLQRRPPADTLPPIDTTLGLRPPAAGPARRAAGWLRTAGIRYRLGRWAIAAGAGLVATIAVGRALDGAESARSGWGRSVEVVLTRDALSTGQVVTADAVEMAAAPARLVASDAVTELPLGRRVTTDVGPGEILVERRLTSRAGSPASVVLPTGTRGVQLPRSEVVGETGDVVDLHALVSGTYLAEAVVVRTEESSVTVAVPVPDVAAVVDAISQGGVISVLVP